MPLVFLCGASAVSFSPELRRVLIVESAMPAAIFPIVLAKHFGGKPGIAIQVCIATSLASLMMMSPMLLMLGLKWFGISEQTFDLNPPMNRKKPLYYGFFEAVIICVF